MVRNIYYSKGAFSHFIICRNFHILFPQRLFLLLIQHDLCHMLYSAGAFSITHAYSARTFNFKYSFCRKFLTLYTHKSFLNVQYILFLIITFRKVLPAHAFIYGAYSILRNLRAFQQIPMGEGYYSGYNKIPECWCVFCLLNVPHVWKWHCGTGVGAKGLAGEGQSNHSMGLVWREVCILAQKATTPSNGFIFIY